MRLLFLGAGGTGGYFGGRAAQAGADVTFLVREPRAARIREQGLRIQSPLGDATLHPKLVTQQTLQDSYDVVVLSCKAYDLDSAIEAIRPAAANPALAARGVRRYADLRTFVADRPGHDRRYAVDATRLTTELGWRPAHRFGLITGRGNGPAEECREAVFGLVEKLVAIAEVAAEGNRDRDARYSTHRTGITPSPVLAAMKKVSSKATRSFSCVAIVSSLSFLVRSTLFSTRNFFSGRPSIPCSTRPARSPSFAAASIITRIASA